MNYPKYVAIGFLTLGLATCDEAASTSGQPSVGSSTDLSAFEGARAGQAELGVQSLGYEVVRSDGLTNYWFNSETGACAAITTSQGVYSSVTMLPAGDC